MPFYAICYCGEDGRYYHAQPTFNPPTDSDLLEAKQFLVGPFESELVLRVFLNQKFESQSCEAARKSINKRLAQAEQILAEIKAEINAK